MDEEIYLEKIALCAYKPETDVNDEERKLRAIEKRRCRESFLYFLKYAKIVETPTLDNPGGVVPLELWSHLKKVIASFLTKRFITILKARQIGLSYITAAYALWHAMSNVGSTILLLSAKEDDAFVLLSKCYEILGQLPEFLQLKPNPNSRGEMGFPIMHSVIKALASTEEAGIGYTASIVVCDEHDDHPFDKQNYSRVKPTIDRAGGQFISIFTPVRRKPETLAKALFKSAIEGKNDFTPLYFPWDVVPGRDEEWYEFTKRNAPPEEVVELGLEEYMAQNYHSSIEEALSRPESVAVFDKKTLNAMKDDVRSPINVGTDKRWEGIDNDIVHIYKDYHIGNFYIAGTDVSLGVGKDYNVTCILNVKTGDIVADIMSQYIAPEELALHSVSLLKKYHNPLWWIEHNLWGRTVIKKAVELGYRRLGYRGEKSISWASFGDDELKKVGFFTDDKSRGDLWGALIPAINDRQITIYNQQGLSQFYDITRNFSPNKKGKIEALSSKHDDYPIAVGICWLKKDNVRTTALISKPIETLTFKNKSESLIEKLIRSSS